MLFTVNQIKVDKNNKEYYVLVNKDNNQLWKFIYLWEKPGITHTSGEYVEYDDSKVQYEDKISETGEHIGSHYLTATVMLEKKDWDYKKATMLDKMKLLGEANKRLFHCCCVRNTGLFENNKYVGKNPNEWEVLFIDKVNKIEIKKRIKTLPAKNFFEKLVKKDVYVWYEVKKSKVGGEFMGLEVKGVEQ